MSIEFKDDAVPIGIWHSRELRRAFPLVQQVWEEYNENVITITCGPEGEHMAGSFHGCGDAVDIRSRIFTPAKHREIAARVTELLQRKYPGQFDFVVKGGHFHLEYDPD